MVPLTCLPAGLVSVTSVSLPLLTVSSTPSVTPTPVAPSSGSAVIVAIGGRSGSAVAWPSSPLVQAASSPMVDPATAAWTTVRRVITGTPLLTAAVRRSGQTPQTPSRMPRPVLFVGSRGSSIGSQRATDEQRLRVERDPELGGHAVTHLASQRQQIVGGCRAAVGQRERVFGRQ